MTRTVKVGLAVDEGPFVRGVKRAEVAAEGLEDALDDVTGSAKDTAAATDRAKESTDDLGDSAKDTGQDLNRLRDDAARLDRQIDETAASVRDLARAIAATSDEAQRADLTRKLTGEQGKLREQVSLRKLIDVDSAAGMGGQLAEQVSLSFAARLGPLLARAPLAGMNPAALAIGAPLAAGVATVVGTAVAGAIVGGAGIGGVVGGLKIAAKDARVQAAGGALGEDIGEMLQRAAAPMVPAALGAIETLRQEALAAEPDLRRVFAASAEYVPILTRGLTDAAHNALPGFVDAVESAEPVIEAVADGMRDLGSAGGDSLSDLSEHAVEGAHALTLLFKTMEVGVEATSDLVEGTAMLYGLSEKMAAVWSGNLPLLAGLVAEEHNADAAARGLAGGLGDVGGAARVAADEAGDLLDALRTLNGLTLSANEAERGFQEAVDDAREAFQGKTRDFVGATEKGREYGRRLDEIAVSARDSAQAIYDQTGNVEAANAKINEGRTALYNQARQYGRTKAEAWEYVDSVLAIPERWNTKVNLQAQEALRDAKAMRSVLQSLRDRDITIGVRWQSNGDLKVPGGTIPKNRWGGVYEHAQEGVLREAQIAAPVAPARYAWAEPATGGEAFIPRFGDRQRSLDILSTAAKWYGSQVVPSSGVAGGGGSQVIENHIHIGAEVVRVVRTEVSESNRRLKRTAQQS